MHEREAQMRNDRDGVPDSKIDTREEGGEAEASGDGQGGIGEGEADGDEDAGGDGEGVSGVAEENQTGVDGR